MNCHLFPTSLGNLGQAVPNFPLRELLRTSEVYLESSFAASRGNTAFCHDDLCWLLILLLNKILNENAVGTAAGGKGLNKKANQVFKPRSAAASPLSLLFQIGDTETSGDCPGALTSHSSFSRSFFLKESFLKIWGWDTGIPWSAASLLLCWASSWESRYNEGISPSQEDSALLLFVSY